MTKRQANTIIGGIIAMLVLQIALGFLTLRGQERTRSGVEALQVHVEKAHELRAALDFAVSRIQDEMRQKERAEEALQAERVAHQKDKDKLRDVMEAIEELDRLVSKED